ncbi:ATP-binding protein [Streptomyces griseoviridis]|uniref:ATP-binding protein n=1 Tax=Streptomyces griseoviridis TaxID=45398 RepID=A0A3Q9KX57_STRGD|nr:ATP-binding protein [Streptomyces griseoviridis]AZS86576.1 ATP-binding protein [Streptomyces griseoviridis]QCN86561.1 ATP-binding protein [Streptomyces griseoviridis]
MPLSRQRRFPRSRASVRDARDFVVQVLTEWGCRDRLDDIRLCASELATNAVLHGVPPGREYSVTVSWDDTIVRLGVRDSGGGTPTPRDADSEACTGRGLLLVREVADDLGVTEHLVGKTVWASFKMPGTLP